MSKIVAQFKEYREFVKAGSRSSPKAGPSTRRRMRNTSQTEMGSYGSIVSVPTSRCMNCVAAYRGFTAEREKQFTRIPM
ncbi:hypothetical protein ACFX1X_032717 [Malus domestica]